jgi:hypothetical protein
VLVGRGGGVIKEFENPVEQQKTTLKFLFVCY